MATPCAASKNKEELVSFFHLFYFMWAFKAHPLLSSSGDISGII